MRAIQYTTDRTYIYVIKSRPRRYVMTRACALAALAAPSYTQTLPEVASPVQILRSASSELRTMTTTPKVAHAAAASLRREYHGSGMSL